MPGPWREVVYIDIATPGRRGARSWVLKLSCGHLAFRSRGDTLSEYDLGIRAMTRGPQFAPKKVRCLFCYIDEGGEF